MRMADEDYSISVSCLVADYMSYRLHKAGYTYQISPTRNTSDNLVMDVIRSLCTEFEKRYAKQFDEMCKDCEDIDLTAESYYNILDNLVSDGIHWGRITAIFSFAGARAVYWMRQGKEERVDMLREWTCSFIHSRIENWINENGGWKGLVDFYKNGMPQKQEEEKKNNGWGYLIGGALGAFAIGALIANRA